MRTICYQDGSDFVLIFSGIDAELKESLISTYGANVIDDAAALPEKAAVLKFVDGPYDGLTPKEALQKDGGKAYIYLYTSLSNNEMYPATEAALKAYAAEQYAGDPYEIVAEWTDARCNSFFKFCGLWITDELRKKFTRGYVSYEAFLKTAHIEQKRAACAATIDLIKR